MRSLLILFVAYVFPASSIAQELQFHFGVKPPPRTLSELKALPGPTPDHQCVFAPIESDSSKPTPTVLPDTTLLFLPQDWQLLPARASDSGFNVTRVAAPDGSRISIEVERNGARGRSFLSYGPNEKLPRGESCIFGSGDVGAIWTFYGPGPAVPDRPLRFNGLGDFITPGFTWYRVSISSKTRQQRDFIARRITNLLLHRRVGSAGIPL
jgi:hypothetical protein